MWLNGEGNGTPLQYSCLESPIDGGVWWAAVHGVAKSQTWLSDFTLTFHFPALEKEMATHSSVLAWRIPETGEPGGLLSVGSHRVGHDWSDLAAAAAAEKSLTTWAKMVQGQQEGMEVKDKRKERRELGWDEHKHGLNSIDWEVKKDVSREGGSKLMNKT